VLTDICLCVFCWLLLRCRCDVVQAHARLCARSAVTLQDAVMAVLVLDSSMCGSSLMGWSNALHTHFPEDPDAEYEELERLVLAGLGLHELMSGGGGEGAAGDGADGMSSQGW
jgi:DNA helicase MCM9